MTTAAQALADLCKNLPAQPEGTMLEQAEQIAEFYWDALMSGVRWAENDADDIAFLNECKQGHDKARRLADSLKAA